MFELLKKKLLTQHELMLYEYLEGHDGKIPYGILNNIQNTVFTFAGKRIMKGAIRRWNHRSQMADLLQRIANNGFSAEEVAKQEAEKRLADVNNWNTIMTAVATQGEDKAYYAAMDLAKDAGASNMLCGGLDVGAGIANKRSVFLQDASVSQRAISLIVRGESYK